MLRPLAVPIRIALEGATLPGAVGVVSAAGRAGNRIARAPAATCRNSVRMGALP